MNINDILNDLGLDLSDPEARRGAVEAIEAILNSRQPPQAISGGGSGNSSNSDNEAEDIEIDPDLIQPSQKHNPPSINDDIEIEDEEDILSQIKRNDSETDTSNRSSDDESDQGDNTETDSTENSSDTSETSKSNSDTESENDEGKVGDNEDSAENSDTNSNNNPDLEGSEEDTSEAEQGNDSDLTSEPTADELGDQEDSEEGLEDFDEEELLDDSLKDLFDDEGIKTKQEARKIKRERTLQAAKKILADAQQRKAPPSAIRELEKAIAALEELTEAVKKSIKDISDEEFNMLINRVFDAIDAVGDNSLTFSSDEERSLKAQEIKNDLSSSRTQNELSAEDAAQIRAETQVIKAREREANKYKERSRDSFKGFQDFLNSLYRAVALQVHVDEVQDDTWSALNRRHSGSGVLQPGKKIQELPNKKIPVIDFYFDCSGSWDESDIAIGQKAVSKLADMEADGQIKINIYYFSNNVFSDAASARAQGGTRAWNDIIKNVIATQATNVIIMTDADMDDWWNGPTALSYTVPGYVWYLWRDGENAPRLPRDLKGRGGTQQFSFSRGDL